jgi:fibronectin type 3 domain-containing protein
MEADSSYNGWNGTLVGGPTWVTGEINNAVSLNGSSQYVTLPAGVVNGFQDFTISAWVNLHAASPWSRIFDFGSGTTSYMFLTPANGATGTVRFAMTTSGSGGEQQINGTSALPTGAWTHVAVTVSGNLGILYVNGVEVGRNSALTLTPASLGSTTQNWIGRSQYSADPYLNGRVDEFRIVNRALTAGQIAALVSLPSAPSVLAATPGNNQITLSWNAVSGATSYNVKRASVSGGPYTAVAWNTTGTSYVDTGLTQGTTYYYVFTAINGVAESGPSAEISAAPLLPPTAPTGLTAAAGNAQVTLSWTPVSGATGYIVQRAPTSNGAYATIASPTTTSYTDTGLTNGTSYYYVVSAVNAGGMSANYSTEVSATPMTPPATPMGLTVTTGDTQATLSWTASPGAASYTIERSGTSSGPYTSVASGVKTTSYTDNGLTNGATYYYVVLAENVGGSSAINSQVSAIPSVPLSATEKASPAIVLSDTGANATASLTVSSSVVGHTYQMQFNVDLVNGTWQNIGSSQVGTGGAIQISTPVNISTTPRCFYRILIQRQ